MLYNNLFKKNINKNILNTFKKIYIKNFFVKLAFKLDFN